MPELKDSQEIRDQVHIVLRGPDGKIKDERMPEDTAEAEELATNILKAVSKELRKQEETDEKRSDS